MTSPEAAVDSPAFRRFFAGSFVVDDQGAPLVVYHSGTFDPAEHPIPKIGKNGMHWGTLDAARARIAGKFVDDFHSALKVSQDLDTGRWHWESDSMASWDLSEEGFGSEAQAWDDAHAAISEVTDASELDAPITAAWLSIKNPKVVPDAGTDWSKVIKKAKAEGHDGLIYQNKFEDKGSTSYVVFHPKQIKSADNAGSFDPDSQNVLEG